MTAGAAVTADAGVIAPENRVAYFAHHSSRDEVDEATLFQLASLRPFFGRIVFIAETTLSDLQVHRALPFADEVVRFAGRAVDARAYRSALRDAPLVTSDREVVFTGNSWFGPFGSYEDVLSGAAAAHAGIWRLIGTGGGEIESFALEGFPRAELPWVWTMIRPDVVGMPVWDDYWSSDRAHDERSFAEYFENRGIASEVRFPAELGPQGYPGILAPGALIGAGCPVLARAVFAQFPPFLDRFAVLLRHVLVDVERRGYPMERLWDAVVRTTPPAALNAMAAMLEVLPDFAFVPEKADSAALRVCVLVHVPNTGFLDELAQRLDKIPGEFDVVLTTTDGRKSAKLRDSLRGDSRAWARRAEVRVTWVPRGRDIGALLLGCRDILLSEDYDLLIRLHGREPRRKPLNVREYGRRYQLENLLSSEGYVERVFDLFRREPGLGLVFPPQVHIGYGTMGRGWGAYREKAEALGESLGIRVPFDEISPLSPYGGMWIGRPAALRRLASHEWAVGDYQRRKKSRGYERVDLTKVQERLLVLAAAESGFHARTIMNREHAQISHSALEYKLDELSTTIRGYPVDQIHLLRRAGWTGKGGVLNLTRMYLRVNHSTLAKITEPAYKVLRGGAFMAHRVLSAVRNDPRDDEAQQ